MQLKNKIKNYKKNNIYKYINEFEIKYKDKDINNINFSV